MSSFSYVHVLRRKSCPCHYLTIVHVFMYYFMFLIVAISVSTHLCVICLFYCLMLLFQGHVACGNFIVIGPHDGSKFVYHNVQAHIPAFPDIFALSPYFSITYYFIVCRVGNKLFTRLMAFCYFKGTIALERKTSIRVQAK